MAEQRIKLKNQFTQPVNQIVTMLAIVIAVFVGGILAYPAVAPIFVASPYLNGFILLVFLGGLVSCFWQTFSLVQSVSWIEGFVDDRVGHDLIRAPRLMASLAALLNDKRARDNLTSSSTRSILDSVATRLDEGREITRYIINLLIFLGLLGTFYGLATTVPAVVDTIRSLAPSEGESAGDVFTNLMSGLEKQLGGMGTAFGSSLLGLAGSLVVGILDLFAGRGQNRFYRELEEWLSSITKVFSAGGADEDGAGVIASIHGLIEVQRHLQSENTAALREIAQGQTQLAEAVVRLQTEGEGILDAETRMRLRNIDTVMTQILEEMAEGRASSTLDLRRDIDKLTKTIVKATKA